MPRRNRPCRRRPVIQPAEPEPTEDTTYEALARELVKTGKCSPLILDHPMHPTERKTA